MKETRKQRKARRAAERVDIGALTEHGRYVLNSIRRDRKRREQQIADLKASIVGFTSGDSMDDTWRASRLQGPFSRSMVTLDTVECSLWNAPVPQPRAVYKDVTCIGDRFARKMIVLV